MEQFALVKQEIERILPSSPLDFELNHAQATLNWTLRLKPDADEALQIAALAHDMERAITGMQETFILKNLINIDDLQKQHALRSAKIISNLLKKYEYDEATIKKVYDLVAKHEIGGGEEADILRDANSIAFFDGNADSYFNMNGPEKTKQKLRWMYQRLSPKAKLIVKKIKFKNKPLLDMVKNCIRDCK